MQPRRLMLAAALFAGASTATAYAQAPGDVPGAYARPAPGYDPGQLPRFQGKVSQYSVTPRGDVDGVILDDGTQVHLPPHLGPQLVAAIKPGDVVTVYGLRAMALPLVQCLSITAQASGQTVTDQGPPPFPPTPIAGQFQSMQVQGRVREPLYGPRGDLNGALLEDGTQVHLPPDQAARWAAILAAGQSLAARGVGVTGPYGRSLEAEQIGPGEAQLTWVGRGLAAGPPGPPPPPPIAPPPQSPPPR